MFDEALIRIFSGAFPWDAEVVGGCGMDDLKVHDLTGVQSFSGGFLEMCREDFEACMGMTPEGWETEVTKDLAEIFSWIDPARETPTTTLPPASSPAPAARPASTPGAGGDVASSGGSCGDRGASTARCGPGTRPSGTG